VLSYGGVIEPARVASIERLGGHFAVTTDDGFIETAWAVLVATGLRDESIGIPGLWDRWGATVHHCPYCHGHEVRGLNIVVIGGASAEASIKQAALLRRYSDRVTVIANAAPAPERLEAFGIRVVDGTVTAVDDDTVTLADGSLLPNEAIFVAPTPRPNDDLLRALGCAHTENGLIAVDGAGQTSVDGVWAAGNVVTPTAQLISAAGAASVSAIAISGWLLQQDMDAALANSINRKEHP
jgi:thioredoxin reductase (NADPH)